MKNGFISIVIAFAGIALGVSLSMRPWKVYQQQKLATEQRMKELHRVEQEHVADLQREARLGSRIGREELARAQGWHRKGEVPAE